MNDQLPYSEHESIEPELDFIEERAMTLPVDQREPFIQDTIAFLYGPYPQRGNPGDMLTDYLSNQMTLDEYLRKYKGQRPL